MKLGFRQTVLYSDAKMLKLVLDEFTGITISKKIIQYFYEAADARLLYRRKSEHIDFLKRDYAMCITRDGHQESGPFWPPDIKGDIILFVYQNNTVHVYLERMEQDEPPAVFKSRGACAN